MQGYVVLFEGDHASGYSPYSPDVPGMVAAGASGAATESLMRSAMAEHLLLLRKAGQTEPEPSAA